MTRLDVSVYDVPTDAPEADGTLEWAKTTVVVVAATAADGSHGLGWSYTGGAAAVLIDELLAGVVVGRPVLDVPGALDAMVRAVRNLGRPGIASTAISAVDLALWDLKARLLDLPLCRLLGQVHLAGLAAVRRRATADVAAGEYGYDLAYFARMVDAGAVDCLQVDATRCGGVTEFLRAAAVAAAHNLQVSAHCAPSLHAHPAAAVPNLRHLEYFHDHERIERLLFDGSLQATGGRLIPDTSRPGTGMELKLQDALPYRVP